MFLGLFLMFFGVILGWLVSGILGGLCVLGGLATLFVTVANRSGPERPRPDYESGARTYEIKSSYKSAR